MADYRDADDFQAVHLGDLVGEDRATLCRSVVRGVLNQLRADVVLIFDQSRPDKRGAILAAIDAWRAEATEDPTV
jgi:hypothetical protein